MFGLFRKRRPNSSKVREWADNDFKQKERTKGKGLPAVQVLSDSLLWGMSRFGNPDKVGKHDLLKSLSYAGDLALFEWACFVYYRVVCWHQDHKVHENQDDVCQFLLSQMIEKFETLAGFTDLRPIVANRFELYGSLEDQDKANRTLFHLEQLIQKSTLEGRPEPYTADEPILITGDVFSSFTLKVHLSSSMQAMLPPILGNLAKFYNMIPE